MTWLLLFGVGAGLSGCQSSMVATPEPVVIDAREYDRVYEASKLSLREFGFFLDRQDYRFGVVTTRPRVSETIFEPGYRTVSTTRQKLSSTLNDERRVVTVFLQPMHEGEPSRDPTRFSIQPIQTKPEPGPAEKYQLRVEVVVERKQDPTLQMTGASLGGGVFGRLGEMPVEFEERNILEPYWQPVSRDPYLESKLQAAIINRSFAMPLDDDATKPVFDEMSEMEKASEEEAMLEKPTDQASNP